MHSLAKEKLDFLSQTGLLYGLTKRQLAEITPTIKEITVAADTVIIKENEVSDEIYVIWEGSVEVSKKDLETGNVHRLSILGKGAVIGEISLLDNSPRSASVKATKNTTLLTLSISTLQTMRNNTDLNKQSLYFHLVENLSKNVARRIRIINDVVVDALERELAHTKARVTMGVIIICVCLIMSFYVLAFQFLKSLQVDLGLGASVLVIVSSIIVITAIYSIIKQTGYPASLFGITFNNWQRSLKEALLFTSPILLALMLGKWILIHYVSGWENRHVFELVTDPQHNNEIFTEIGVINFLFYLLLVPFQELLVRGALQGPLEELFVSPHRKLMAIVVSNLLFSVTHTHLSVILAFPVFLLGLFWGWLYSRTRTLIGVILSHWLVGMWAIFIIDIRPPGVG